MLLALTLITLSTRGSGSSSLRSLRTDVHRVLNPVESGVHDVLRPVGNFVTGAFDYGQLRAENDRLRAQLAKGAAEQAELQYLEQTSAQILALARIPWAGSFPTVTAPVTQQPSSNFETTITIGKGSSSGVAVGQPVISTAGLAGSVSAVYPDSATVTLITDPSFTVGVALPGDNIGTATGQGTGNALALQVIGSAKAPPVVRRGSVLVTSGLLLTDPFPPGLPVGRVVSVRTEPGETEPSVTLAPLASTADLGFVNVLLWSPQ